ncbi:uncharacterized protein LOC124932775 [Impatiens glandulifera]|uniref:uncharacterized protein LOC124932775 n=1 Tax=Impatiens glandulifera TaxID=253017 RepID=UPI001FB135CC|nr:uncharacterized protein LOC124932775 [Impatiens glandulifera]
MSALVWLLVFLSLHVCNARHHLVHREKIGNELYNHNKDSKAPCMELDKLFKLGKKTKASSSLEIIPELTIISLKEKCNIIVRRKLGLELEEGKKSANSMEEQEEDIDVMDYTQPHRKPPIHNKETLN